ncbi:hypothetical protein O181_033819 [Austropuccinia psidii MF-1]|uniref:Uncharacterized protein n=1 Tax=Austropuccinia psidii MF-1 TaxID=1389203 RepID=A0A9Q3CZT7_9BASI|nr:hypothetical protein [Austropuccinia psidii MF-1]
MLRLFCVYGLEFKYSDGFTHYWFTLIPELGLAYKTSVHSSTGQTPSLLEKVCNRRLPADTLRKDLVYIHPTASSFKMMLDKVSTMKSKELMMLLTMQNRSGTRVIKYQT